MNTDRVTIYQVAEAAGVAPSTVSRALSRPGRVSAETHQRVLAAARALGYRTREPLRIERPRQMRRLGVEVPDLANPFFAEVVAGMQDTAQEHDYLLLLLDSAEDGVRERESLRRAVDIVDGVVLAGSRLSDAALVQVAKHVPTMVLNRRVAGLDSLSPDIENGMGQVLAHLRAGGAREVLYLAGPENSWSDGERWRAARLRATEHGLVMTRRGPFAPTSAGGEQAYGAVREDLPHAVICYNDLIAYGFLVAALRDGVHVPRDIQVVGHDDLPYSPLIGPGLTTLATPKRDQGRAAVDRMIRRIENPSKDRVPVDGTIGVRLVVRGSTTAGP